MHKNRRSRKVDFRRVLAAVLCFVMTVSYMPSTVVAAEVVAGEEIFTETSADSFDADNTENPEVTDASFGEETEGEEVADDELPSDEAVDEAAVVVEGAETEEMADVEEQEDAEDSEDIEAEIENEEVLMNTDPVGDPETEPGEEGGATSEECGKYYVRVNKGEGVPDDVAISMMFNTQGYVDYKESMEAPADIPFDGDIAPDRLIFSIPEENFWYLAEGWLEISDDSGKFFEKIDLLDKIGKNARVNNKYMYTYGGNEGEIVSTEYRYEISVTFKRSAVHDVVFDFEHVQGTAGSDHPLEDEYRLTPVKGLEYYDPNPESIISGETFLYKYSGGGDIVLKVEKKIGKEQFVDPTREDLTQLTEGRVYRLAGFFESYVTQDEPPFYLPEYSAEGTYITVPAFSGDYEHPFPIRDMMELALERCEEDEQPVVTLYAYPQYELAKQVELTEEDSVKYDFSLGEVEYNDRTYPGSNVEKITEQIDEKNLNWYAIGDEDRIFFKADPIGDGVVIEDIIYRAIESRDEYGEIVNVSRSDYPQGKAELIDAENGIYTISVPRNKDGDWGSVLGLKLEPMTRKMTTVTVTLDDDEKNPYFYSFENGEARAFDVTLRVGAQEYGTYFDFDETGKHTVATGFIPYGENVYVTIESADGYNLVQAVKLGEQSMSPDKNGEYALKTANETEVALKVTTAPVTRLCLTVEDEYGDAVELDPENGTYSIGYTEPFTAALLSGSVIDEEEKVFVPAAVEATFKLGDEIISAKDGVGFENNALITDGNSLGAAGKTVSLSATSGGLTKSATITFSTPITKDMITVIGAKDKVVTGPYATDFSFGIKYAKGTDPGEIQIVSAKKTEGGKIVLDNERDLLIGTYDDTALYVDCNSVLRNYEPGDEALIAFTSIAEPDTVIDTYTVKLTYDIDGKTPIAKADPAIATHMQIGLKLGLPKGVKSSENLYYKVSATARKVVYDENNKDNNNLSMWDDEEDKFVQIYKDEIVEYFHSYDKSALIYVMNGNPDPEWGWAVDYDVTVSLIYCDLEYDDSEYEVVYPKGTDSEWASNEAEFTASTRDLGYETKLKLTKKAPSKIYSGQRNVAVAAVNWSKTTTLKALDRVELIGPYGNVIADWNSWNWWMEEEDNNYEISVEDDIISIDTVRENGWWEGYEWHEEKEYLAPGKYTLTAKAFAGPGISPAASVSFQIVNGITDLEVSAPSNVYKAYNKKAGFKAEVSYFGFEDRIPANKKVTWKILKGVRDHEFGGYVEDEFDPDDPLFKALTVKANGTVTLDPSYKVRPYAEDNTFVLKAIAADYDRNTTVAYSEPVTISSIAREPARILFRWWNWDEDDYNYSNVTEEAIKGGEKFFTNNINGATICVLDQFGDEMEADIKVTGMDLVSDDGESRIVVKKVGNKTVKATSRDGGKKSKTLKFTLVNTDGSYVLNTLIQDADRRIINISEDGDPYDTHVKGKDTAKNSYSANMPIYVNVAGVRCDDKDEVCDNAAIAHKISVKGGKVAETIYGEFEHYTTYRIIPSARQTIITIKDNTKGNTDSSRKKEHIYTVTNTGISTNTKALSIKADKKSIFNRLWAPTTLFGGPENVPNRVTYSIKNVPTPSEDGKKLKVRLTMDEPNGDAHNIARFLGIEDDDGWFIADGAYADVDDGTFVIDFFEEEQVRIGEDEETGEEFFRPFYGFWDTKPGTYKFYATLGEAEVDKAGYVTEFTPLAKMTKISLKVAKAPTSSGSFKTKKYALDDNGAAKLEIATVKNGLGVKYIVGSGEGGEVFFDAYRTMSTSKNGKVNRFIDLFEVDNPEFADEGEFILKEKPKLKARDGFWEEIAVGKDKVARIGCWDDLYLLKNGEYKDSGALVGTAKEQKTAYNKWAKENLTGYIGYRVVDYTGQEIDQYQSITVDITAYLEKVHAEALNEPAVVEPGNG